ncbi:MAG: rRNA maturation RNase YbeY [Clostridia bacterium]|nr:rRNA maturation RNase YbeY [Clostridia bacterium]
MNAKVNITVKEKSVAIPREYRALIRKACNATLKYEGFIDKAEINVTIVDDEEIRELNREFRDIDKSTDVLSFPLGEDGVYDYNPETDALMLGDIVISVDHAIAQAELYGHGIEREIAFLTVHSMLHLLGYDHVHNELEEKEMFSRQEQVLKLMGLEVKK